MQRLLSRLWETRAKIRRDKGFTLIELLVVVVILGVLIAIAIPLYLNYRKGANDKAAEADLRNGISVLEQCYAANGTYQPLGTVYQSPPNPMFPPCPGQAVNASAGTVISYFSPNGASYTIAATNSNGSGLIYCYNSAKGGSIATAATMGIGATPAC